MTEKTLFFPAAGNYNGTSLNNRGSNGNYWSSSWISATNARNLNFNSSSVNPQNSNNRRNGFSLRGVSTYCYSILFAFIMVLTREKLLKDLYIAFYDARRHKSKMSYVVKFEENLKDNIENLCDELYNRTYEPLPSKCFIVDYPKKREVFAARFKDRIVHHLYYGYTNTLFERTFIQDSYSCIKGRGTHYGVERLKKHIRQESQNWQNTCYVMKIDIRGYFMHINRRKLLDIAIQSLDKMSTHKVSKYGNLTWDDAIDMEFVRWLTKKIIMLDPKICCTRVGKDEDWIGLDKSKSLFYTPNGCGLPIGNLTSQLFSNVYLNVFDQYMKRTLGCKHYGRYVDDSYIVSCNKEWLLSLIPKIREFLKSVLELDMHMGKTIISSVHNGVEFLGVYVKPFRSYISRKTLKRIEQGMRNLDFSFTKHAVRTINSYLGIMQHAATYNIRKRLFFNLRVMRLGVLSQDISKIVDRESYFSLNT